MQQDLTDTAAFGAHLDAAGVPDGTRAAVTAEGLLMYLPPPAGTRLLRSLASRLASGPVLAFDFMPQSFVSGAESGPRFARLATAVAARGEPLLWGLPTDGDAHAALAYECGWRVEEVLSPGDIIEARFFGPDAPPPPVLPRFTWFAVRRVK